MLRFEFGGMTYTWLDSTRRLSVTSRTGSEVARAEDLGERALMLRIEVLDEHERHAGIEREVSQERRERLETAGGGADADNR